MKWLQLKNFTPLNAYYAIQGHYRKFILKEYQRITKFSFNDLPSRIIEFESCLGTHPDCGCPMVEVLLSDKPYSKCK